MLRSHAWVLSRLACLPSTSRTSIQSASSHSNLPENSVEGDLWLKVKPVDDELPCNPSTSAFTAPRVTPLPLTAKQHHKHKLTIIEDHNLRLWTKMEPRGLASAYLQLSKHKLTFLITSTAVAGYFMGSGPISLTALLGCAGGTALLSSAANACNQLLEAPYDAQMKRTQARVLVLHRFSPLHAFSFATMTTVAGLTLLMATTNVLTASLGLMNLILYAGVYTPMKRTTIACTWAGAVVGAIPPLMGYAASSGCLDLAALTLAAILYSWQFPHFNGLSWNLRGDYSKAGYRVMCVTDEGLCRRTSLRHSLSLVALCSAVAPFTDLTTLSFAVDSIPLNVLFVYLSYRFYKAPDAKNSRQLFFFSLLYLPCIMILMAISNGGRNQNQKKAVTVVT